MSVGTISFPPPHPAARPDSRRESAGTGELASSSGAVSSTELTEEEQRIVAQLKARDREVRAHEQAHKSVGGRYAGAITYDYDEGPDGKQYAVGGEVPIDASPVQGDPKATVAKMEIVIAAALAPAEPSAQDRSVARAAQAAKIEALAELRSERERDLGSSGDFRLAPSRNRESAEAGAQFANSENSRVSEFTESSDIIAALGGYGEVIAAFALGAERANRLGVAQIA
ncbi:MAG: putative metalloprotease CJM1_0395 family protein [Pseudomonadota bacterium]